MSAESSTIWSAQQHGARQALSAIAKEQRFTGLDAARFIGSAAIVWLHTLAINPAYASVAELGRFAVPFFTVSATALMIVSLRKKPGVSFLGYLRTRFQRLYYPFLAWTLIYLLLRDAKYMARRHGELVAVGPYLLLIGSTHHLWFLPFLLTVSILLFPLATAGLRYARLRRPAVLLLTLLAAVIASMPAPVQFDSHSADFLGRIAYGIVLGWDALPAAILGFVLGLEFQAIQRLLNGRSWLATLFLVVFIGSVAWTSMEGRSRLVETLSGVCLFLAALFPMGNNRVGTALGNLGHYAYGIYLVHAAIVLGLEALLVARPRSDIDFWQLIGIFAASLAASTLLTAALRRYTITRWLVP